MKLTRYGNTSLVKKGQQPPLRSLGSWYFGKGLTPDGTEVINTKGDNADVYRQVVNVADTGVEILLNYPIPPSATITHDGTATVVNSVTKLTFSRIGTFYNAKVKDWTGRTLHEFLCDESDGVVLIDRIQDNFGIVSSEDWTLVHTMSPALSNGFGIVGTRQHPTRGTLVTAESMISHADSGNVWYVRPSGGAYGDEDGSSYDNAWDGFTNIDWTASGVQAGDTLYVCGTHTELFTIGGSGTDGNYIVIRMDYATDAGKIDSQDTRNVGINVNSKDYVWFKSPESIDAVVSCINIEGTSEWIITEDGVFSGSGNQGVQHLDTAKAIHLNISCSDCVDDGISMHDDTRCIIETATVDSTDEGINHIDTSELLGYDITVTNSGTSSYYTISYDTKQTYAFVDRFSFDNDCKNIQADTGVSYMVCKNGSSANTDVANFYNNSEIYLINVDVETSTVYGLQSYGGNTKVVGSKIKCNGTDDTAIFTNNSNAIFINNFFYNLDGSKASIKQKTTGSITGYNNTFVGKETDASEGIAVRADDGTTSMDNNIFLNIKWAFFDEAGSSITADNNCFYNNTKDRFYTNATITNSVTTDPKLNTTTGIPASDSSCIDTGKDLGFQMALHPDHVFGSADKRVIQDYFGTAWNIGAFIYNSETWVETYAYLTGLETGYADHPQSAVDSKKWNNMACASVNLTDTIFDRSNATNWKALARSATSYDSGVGRTNIWNLNEITLDNISTWMESAIYNRIFEADNESNFVVPLVKVSDLYVYGATGEILNRGQNLIVYDAERTDPTLKRVIRWIINIGRKGI